MTRVYPKGRNITHACRQLEQHSIQAPLLSAAEGPKVGGKKPGPWKGLSMKDGGFKFQARTHGCFKSFFFKQFSKNIFTLIHWGNDPI